MVEDGARMNLLFLRAALASHFDWEGYVGQFARRELLTETNS